MKKRGREFCLREKEVLKTFNYYWFGSGLFKLWVATPNRIAKEVGILCFVPGNFENSSSATELFEKIMVIACVIGKSGNSEIKLDKLELDSDWEAFFFRKHLIW